MPKSSSKSAKRKAPWKKAAPKGSRHTHLSPSQKSKAKRSAKRAGRPYPNLVDNMRVATKKSSSGTRKKKSSAKTATKKSSAKTAKKNAKRAA